MRDMTPKEQANVRTALLFLRSRCGGWEPLGKVLGFRDVTLRAVARGGSVSASLAFRIARFASVGVDDVLRGNFPAPGTCPYCGHRPENIQDA
jgi:hypothetical protein